MPTVYSRHVDPEEKAPPKKKVSIPAKPIVEEKIKPPIKAAPPKTKKEAPAKEAVKKHA